ncbi:diguanylate cyclase/phosphodiesterase [Rippkaea orientalis PCC 8801]|uniref:Diguanylate cyclase/phosphodiesterase n=1 Tax=Rippkaea orientalis (strain PCC 8801 / RF-1) TaxID=41431 RepID=B7K503_RIPO1|nr:EAL domain-containing protein [Rippkaea orientalis]ACK66659.1 diguanylate cyclase/phosphodiesterase [Rippkaea orientalis PCC 8801]
MNLGNNKAKEKYVLIIEDSHSRQTIMLEEDKYSIGRHSSNSIVIPSRQISRIHATLIRKINRQTDQDSFWILDGDLEGNRSQNRIFVNGEKCLVHELKDGDLINFGCEVNASYHLLSSGTISETLVDQNCHSKIDNPEPEKETQVMEKFPRLQPYDPHKQETLRLDISPIQDENDEDTFIEKSYTDPLTDLPNQILVNEYLSIALTNAKRNKNLVGLILIDIKDFKKINDNVSYSIGDQILQQIAKRLKDYLRSGDIVGRWGGDQFSILLTQVKTIENVEKVIKRLIKILQEPLPIDKQIYTLDYYLGLAIYPQDGDGSQRLIGYVERQIADAKKSGNCITLKEASAEINSQLLQFQKRLKQALIHQELSLHYQPQVNIITGQIEGVEALIRWHHPKQGLLLPQKFLSWAEKTDLLIPLTRWILETACTQNKAWQNDGLPPILMSVNLSTEQFYHPQLIKLIKQVLLATGLKSRWLELEITETTILKDSQKAYRILKALQHLGVSLCLDDFGKGYGAISYLSDSPFQKLKIDLSVIQKLKENPENTMMISALIALAEKFQMRVVAEGVETQQQLDVLYTLQCDAIQGYRFSRPLPVEEATEFLQFNSHSNVILQFGL